MKNRQWVLARRPQGSIQDSDFNFIETDVPALGEGDVLVRTLMLSCDPTQRGWIAMDTYLPAVRIGEVVRSLGAGRVVASNNPEFAVGDIVSGFTGWQDYLAINPRGQLNKLPPGAPLELAMSVLGMNGVTAYFGLIDVGRPSRARQSSYPARPARRARWPGRSPRSRGAASSASRAGRRNAAG